MVHLGLVMLACWLCYRFSVWDQSSIRRIVITVYATLWQQAISFSLIFKLINHKKSQLEANVIDTRYILFCLNEANSLHTTRSVFNVNFNRINAFDASIISRLSKRPSWQAMQVVGVPVCSVVKQVQEIITARSSDKTEKKNQQKEDLRPLRRSPSSMWNRSPSLCCIICKMA